MRILITGGAGFIGSHLLEQALRAGHDALVIDNLSSGTVGNLLDACCGASVSCSGLAQELEKQAVYRSERLNVRVLDIVSPAVDEIFSEFNPHVVFHTAAQMSVRHSVADPFFDSEVNVAGTVRLLEASRKAAVRYFLFSSTGGAIYGEQEKFPADESHRTLPEAPYGVSKRAAELYLEYFARATMDDSAHGQRKEPLTTVALRYANVYGPRQNPRGEAGVIAIFSNKVIAGHPLRINGTGKQTRDFVYVTDVVRAHEAVLSARLEDGFHTFNVGTGVETDINQVAAEIIAAKRSLLTPGDKEAEVIVEHGPALPGEQMRSVIDHQRLTSRCGWRPMVGFAEGISRTVKSFMSSQ